MKILHIVDNIAINSGVSTSIINLYQNINQNRIQFDFLVGCEKEYSYEQEIKRMKGEVYYVGLQNISLLNMPYFIYNVRNFFKNNSYKYNIAHLHSIVFCFPYLYFAKKNNIKNRIAHCHASKLSSNPVNEFRNKLLVYPLSRLATNFVSCSNLASKNVFLPLGIDNYDIFVNGIDCKKYSMNLYIRNKMRNEFNIRHDDIVIGHISNMTPLKNVEFVINVFNSIKSKCKNSKLILIGKEKLPENIINAIRCNNLSDSVFLLGVRFDIANLLQMMDVCLLPSRAEGLGITAVECQAANVPVITSYGFPEDIYLTDIIHRLNLDVDLWAELSIKIAKLRTVSCNKERLTKKFDISNTSKFIMDYYSRLP